MPKSLLELEGAVSRVLGAAEYVQVDVMDGKFVSERSWPFPDFYKTAAPLLSEEDGLPFWDKMSYEFDLMISEPDKFAEKFIIMGAGRIIIHFESAAPGKIREAIRKIKAMNTEVGIAINTSTPNDVLDEFINDTEDRTGFVQFMGIEKIGYQGEPFDERVIPKIKALREKYPDIIISIDGGVNPESAPRLIKAGANRLVAGSAIFGSGDSRAAIEDLMRVV